jgi:hypothetical protein
MAFSQTDVENKDQEIHTLIAWLRDHLLIDFVVVDHWDADRFAIGVAAPVDLHRLVYISSWKRPTNQYFVALETSPADGSDMPYASVGKFESVDRERLAHIVTDHLCFGPDS